MDVVEKIFFSGTFGGETLSLAAAKACLLKIREHQVIQFLHVQGQKIVDGLTKILDSQIISPYVKVRGHPSWSFVIFSDINQYPSWDIKTFFMQEVFKRGIYTLGTHNMSFAHADSDIRILLDMYADVFGSIQQAVTKENLHEQLKCSPLVPLFKVR